MRFGLSHDMKEKKELMMKNVTEMTVAELERALEAKRAKLKKLIAQKEGLEKKLGTITAEIEQLGGASTTGKARIKKSKTSGSVRLQNERTLKEVVTTLLTSYKDGLGLSDLAQKVLETGYKTSSTNFKNTLYQCLYNHTGINLDKLTGLYRLVS